MTTTVIALTPVTDRAPLIRRARMLAWSANAWHVAEFGIALGAGLAASSIALIGFGFDSAIEAAAGFVVLWRFADGRSESPGAERRAQLFIAASFFLLAAYVTAEALDTLAGGVHPETSWVGIGLAAVTAAAMPALARAKRNVARRLGSAAAVNEASQNMLCAYLSIALLVGLLANALAGWWWADPAAALVVAAVAVREGIAGWRGESCECC